MSKRDEAAIAAMTNLEQMLREIRDQLERLGEQFTGAAAGLEVMCEQASTTLGNLRQVESGSQTADLGAYAERTCTMLRPMNEALTGAAPAFASMFEALSQLRGN